MRILDQPLVEPVGIRLYLGLYLQTEVIERLFQTLVFRVARHLDLAPADVFAQHCFQLTHVQKPLFQLCPGIQWTFFQLTEKRFQAVPIRHNKVLRQKMPHRFCQFCCRFHRYFFLAAFFGFSAAASSVFFAFSAFTGLFFSSAFFALGFSASAVAFSLVTGFSAFTAFSACAAFSVCTGFSVVVADFAVAVAVFAGASAVAAFFFGAAGASSTTVSSGTASSSSGSDNLISI